MNVPTDKVNESANFDRKSIHNWLRYPSNSYKIDENMWFWIWLSWHLTSQNRNAISVLN